MRKGPIKVELIALTDNLGLIELFQEFVEFISRQKIKAPMVYQDYNAVVMLVTKGRGILRTNICE